MRMTNMRVIIMKAGFLALLTLMAAAPAYAASEGMAPTIKAAFDKMAAAAEPSLGSRLTLMYRDLLTAQEQNDTWDQTIKTIHSENAERLGQIRQQMKQLDADKRRRLELDYKQAKDRYEPLLSAYTALNRQIVLSSIFKSKDATAVLRAQAEAMKLPVQAARHNLKAQSAALQAAKSATAKTVQQVRQTIAETNALQDQLKARRKSISALDTRFNTAWNGVSRSVRKGDPSATLTGLTDAVSSCQQRNEQKQSGYALEIGIRDILEKARTRLE